MAADEGLVTGVGGALAVCFCSRSEKQVASPLDFSARAGSHLLLRIFFTGFSNQGIDRATGHSAGRRIFAYHPGSRSVGGRATWPPGLLVRADAALVFERAAHADGNLLGGDDRIGAAGFEFVASGDAGDLLCVFPFLYRRGTGFFGLSIGWNAARSRIHFPVFCTARMASRLGREQSAFANELVPAGVGMLPHLFRVGS